MTTESSARHPAVPPLAFYETEAANLDGPPGSLIDAVELEAPAGIRAWAVLYRSTGLDGAPIGVSGLIVSPVVSVGSGGGRRGSAGNGLPVLAWAHGTTGLADACAPSRAGVAAEDVLTIVDLARQGFVVAATDYEGLGTAGIHPYLVGPSEGRSVLDAIRAVQHFPEAGAGPRAAVLGISQGGHAALWAAELGPSYAPDLDLVGVVAASPPIDLQAVQRAVLVGPQPSEFSWLEALLAVRAWHEVYGVSIAGLVTDEGRAIMEALGETCPWELASPVEHPILDLEIPEWQALLVANSPGHAAAAVPILVVAAESDEQVPASTIGPGVDRLRAAGSTVQLWWIAGTHVSTLTDPAAAAASLAWIGDRFAGRDTADG
ncbi:MAG TPA: lipase family protein [Candidatus Eisenbacteria bacterium]|nr:lipase family protein [Candidatus Eisenbacteria bacterium]